MQTLSCTKLMRIQQIHARISRTKPMKLFAQQQLPIQHCFGGTSDAECCSDSDCTADAIYVYSACLPTSPLRSQLHWVGDDDLDLYVVSKEPMHSEVGVFPLSPKRIFNVLKQSIFHIGHLWSLLQKYYKHPFYADFWTLVLNLFTVW
mmetsp:Transcript_24366/g.56759  ORF Transcript_24366/g.56759 Transcript_24366/m.56759 type:complete len:148 (+) Transcript_24366:1080-1523(+)